MAGLTVDQADVECCAVRRVQHSMRIDACDWRLICLSDKPEAVLGAPPCLIESMLRRQSAELLLLKRPKVIGANTAFIIDALPTSVGAPER